MKRENLQKALSKPTPKNDWEYGQSEFFDPWQDVFPNIDGGYAADCDVLMVSALECVLEHKPFEIIDSHGFAGEFALYVLSGHDLTEYGTSPRGAWPHPSVSDLFPSLIQKWKDCYKAKWGSEYPA